MSDTIKVILDAVTKPFQKDMDAGAKAVGQFSRDGKTALGDFKKFALGAFSVGAAVSFGKEIMRLGSEIYHTSQMLRMSADDYQAYRVLVEEAGGSTSDFERAINNLTQRQDEALDGNENMVATFAKLGVTLDDLAQMDPGELFQKIAGGVAGADDQTAAFSATAELFGRRAGPALFEALNNLASLDFSNFKAGLRESGEIMDAELTQRLAAAEDAIARFQRRLKIFAGEGITTGGNIMQALSANAEAAFTALLEGRFSDALSPAKMARQGEALLAERLQAEIDQQQQSAARRNRGQRLSRQAREQRLDAMREADRAAVSAGDRMMGEMLGPSPEDVARYFESMDGRLATIAALLENQTLVKADY